MVYIFALVNVKRSVSRLIREFYHDDLQLLHRVRVHGGVYEPPS